MRPPVAGGGLLDGQLVVSTPNVLHQRMPGDDHPGTAVPLEAAHRSQPRLRPTVVALDAVVGVAAGALGVDRSTIMRLRTVAKDGAIQALAESTPGVAAARRDLELEAARAEAARLGEAAKELAVKLVLVEGNGRWD
jgi:transposase